MITRESITNLDLRACALGAFLFTVLSAPSSAADPDAGAVIAQPCLSCHFADDFTGESEAQILALIEETLADPMHPPSEGSLSETDLADIAAFFARGR